MNKIFFDTTITGHHSEYIAHLVDYILKNPSEDNYVFVVPKDINQKFPHIIQNSKNSDKISWDFIENEEVASLQNLPLAKRSFKEYETMNRFALKHRADMVYLLYFNIFQLSLIFRRPPYNIAGILFLQFYRMEINSWKDKVKYYKKYLTTKLYSLNPSIKTIFILNDDKTVDYLNRKLSTGIFKMLPDPIPEYIEEKGFNVYDFYKIPKSKKILLHPGAIDPRKGTYEIIDSINYFEDEVSKQFVILIVGKAKKEIDEEIKMRLSNLKNKDFQIVYDNTFVSNERLKSLFMQSFGVLIPYKNTEASSGVLGHAIAAGKPVVVPNKGLIGEIVRENDAGVLIEEVDCVSIAESYLGLFNYQVDSNKFSEFLLNHTTEAFTNKIFSN